MTTISSPTQVLTPAGIRNYILEGVDNLRIRKCRPDRETIAHYVLRKYGGTLNDIFNELENIVDEGILLKVEYKGSTSYRTPESFDQKNSPLLTKHSKILNSSRTTRLILTSINDLLAQNPDYCTLGIPIDELKAKLTALEPVRFQDDKLNVAFNREVSVGNVLLGDGGRVYPKDIQPRKNAMKEQDERDNGQEVKVPKKRGRKSNAERLRLQAEKEANDETVEPRDEDTINERVQEAVRKTFDGRVSGRNKRKTKVFDPSDVVTPPARTSSKKKKRGSVASGTMDSCEICNKKSDKGLVICATCACSFHLHCLGLNESSWSDWNEWVCVECRICNACSTLLKNMKHTECGKCKSGFHVACVGEEEGFVCGDCVFKSDPDSQNKQQDVIEAPKKRKVGRPPKRKIEPPSITSSSPAKKESPEKELKPEIEESVTEDEQEDGDFNKKEKSAGDLNVKNCSEWGPTEVEQYFTENGLAEAGADLRRQEVDGLSLLLMKRSDVIFGLNLRLGPALKVYKLILQLQSNVN